MRLTSLEGSDLSGRRAATRPTRVAWRPLTRRVVLALVVAASLLTGVVWTIGAATRTITTQEQAFPATDIDTLRIDGGAGPVTIVVVDRGDVVVTTRLTDSALGRITSRRAVSGRTLTITTDCERRCLAATATADHQIALPRATIETMDLRPSRGDVRVDGFAGDIEVVTTDGDIFLSHFGGEVTQLRTTQGLIRVETGDAETRQVPGWVYAAPRSHARCCGHGTSPSTLRDGPVVHPRGDPATTQRGVFSSRSPARPNPIGLHRVGGLRTGP